MAIFCLFLTCTPESSEAGKFVEITNQSEQSYVEPKAYKETKSNPDSCRVKHYKENISGTWTESKKAYKAYGECLLAIHNEQAMPKDIACQQKDGFNNYKLQFQWDFSDKEYFDEVYMWGFYKFNTVIYFSISEHHLATYASYNQQFFEYDCEKKVSKEIKIPVLVAYWNFLVEKINKSTSILLKIWGGVFRWTIAPFSIWIYDKSKDSIQQFFLFDEEIDNWYQHVKSDFSWSEIIQKKITQYINDYGVGKYMQKHNLTEDPRENIKYLATFDIKDFNKNLKWKLIVTMPWFQAIFNIDLKKKKIRR